MPQPIENGGTPDSDLLSSTDILMRSNLTVRPWTESYEDAVRIVEEMDIPLWAPWYLEKPEAYIQRATLFPRGQLLLTDKQGQFAGYLTTNLITWNESPESLPTWDGVAGMTEHGSYADHFDEEGNAIILLAMSVHSNFQRLRLPQALIGEMQKAAKDIKASYILSPFRPSGFGVWKWETGGTNEDFRDYVDMTQEKDDIVLPVDPWLRSLARNGMTLLRNADGSPTIRDTSVEVHVSLETFDHYRNTFKAKDDWREVEPGMWECKETGAWFVSESDATYREPNVWGSVPIPK